MLLIISQAQGADYKKHLAWQYIELASKHKTSNPDSFRLYLDTCQLLLKKKPNNDLLHLYLFLKLTSKQQANQNDEAAVIAKQIMPYFESQKDYEKLGEIHYAIGEYNQISSLFNEALEQYWQSSIFFDSAKNEKRYMYLQNAIGTSLYDLRKEKQANEYFKASLTYAQKLNDTSLIITTLNNLANSNEPNEAINYYLQCIEYINLTDKKSKYAGLYMNLALSYADISKLDSAFYYIYQAKQLCKANNNQDKLLIITNLGFLHSDAHHIDSALYYANLAIKTLNKQVDNHLYEQVLNLKSEIAFNNKEYKKAHDFLLQAYKYSDSINESNLSYNLKQLNDKFLYKQKAKETEFLMLENENKQITIKHNRNKLIVSSIIVVFLLLIIIIAGYHFKKQKKLLVLLNKKHDEIKGNNIQLRKTLRTRDTLMSIIAHDIKSPLATIKGFSDLLVNDDLTQEQTIKYADIINKSTQNLISLVDNLLNWANYQRDQFTIECKALNVSLLINNNINLLEQFALDNHIQLKNECSPLHNIFADTNTSNTIIRNMLSNAIKFSKPNSEVVISSSKTDDFTIIHFKDNGIGIQKDQIPMLFNQDVERTRIGNHKNKGTGIGLLLCNDFAILNGGSIHVESEFGKGSTFSVSFQNT